MARAVFTPSRVPEAISDTPGQVIVVTRRQIEERGYRSLNDVLRDLPSVDIQRYSGPVNRIQLRGITGQKSNDQFLVLLNGHRINEPTNSSITIADNFPIHAAHQIEVVYGPYSSLYGSDAIAGVINIITRAADTQTIRAQGETGGHGYRRSAAYGSGTVNDFEWHVAGHYTESDNQSRVDLFPDVFELNDLVTFAGQVSVPANQRRAYRFPVESWGVYAEGAHAGGSVGIWHSKIKAPSWGSDRPDRVNYNADAVRDQRLTTGWIDQTWKPVDRWTFEFGADYSRGELAPKSLFNNIFTEYQNGYIYLLGERTQFEARSIFEHEDLRWISGISFGRFHAISSEADLSVPYNPDKPITEQDAYYLGTENTLKAKIFDVRYNNVGGFTEVVRQWNDRVRSTAGVRFDDHGLSETSFAPRLSLNVQLSERTQLKGLFGAAFKSPSPHTIYQHFGAFTGQKNDDGLWTSFFFRVPNTDLRPEESRTFESVFFHFPSDTWSWSLAGYYNVVKDAVESGPTETTESDFIPGGVIFDTDTNQNLGELKAWGINLGAQGHLRDFLGGRLSVWGHYDWLDGELTDPLENTVIGVPFASNHKLRAGAEWTWKGLTLSPRFYWFGSGIGPVTDPESDNFGVKVPSYRLINLFASYKTRHLPAAVFLRIENLLDTRYNNIGGGGSSTFLASPQDGRWIQFGLRISG